MAQHKAAKNVILSVSGSVAACKSASVLRGDEQRPRVRVPAALTRRPVGGRIQPASGAVGLVRMPPRG